MLGHRHRVVSEGGGHAGRVLQIRSDPQPVHEVRDPRAALAAVGPQRRQVARLRERGAQRDPALVLGVPIAERMPADDAVLVVEQ